MPIGPKLPPHLLDRANDAHDSGEDDEREIGPSLPPQRAPSVLGPQLPAHLAGGSNNNGGNDDDEEEEDDYVPSLPPELAASRAGGSKPAEASAPGPSTSSQRRVLGPSLPGHDRYEDDEVSDDSDDDFGPRPPPAHGGPARDDGVSEGVREFLEREERIRKAKEEAVKPQKMKRDEWMLVPPSSSDLLGKLADPLKIKARQFSASSVGSRSAPSNLWTETPQERMQRVADEVAGVKRRAVNAPEEDKEDKRTAKRRKEAEEEVRKAVDNFNKSTRNKTLLDMHSETTAKKKSSAGEDEGPPVIWDHARDMSVGGRLMDDKDRGKLIADARGLDDRFGRGKSNFL